jgi:hypothetical protein
MPNKLSPKDVLTFMGITPAAKPEPETVETPRVKRTPESLGEKQVLMAWKSLARPERQGINRKFMRTGIVIGLVVALFLALMQEFFLILVVASIVFFAYILINSPIEMHDHEISTHGIKTQGQMFYWYELTRFFFTTNADSHVLAVDTFDKLPSRLYLLYAPDQEQKLKEICEKYIPYLEKEPLTSLDKAYSKVLGKFNFGNS